MERRLLYLSFQYRGEEVNTLLGISNDTEGTPQINSWMTFFGNVTGNYVNFYNQLISVVTI